MSSRSTPPLPGAKAPDLSVSTTDGGSWELAKQTPENFTLLIFYRGLHCPICKSILQELNKNVGKFEDKGTQVFVVSMDSQDRASRSKEEWDIDKLAVGYGLTEDQARDWGLFFSESIKEEEPQMFSEPAVFIIKPDQTLFAAYVQSAPFARPRIEDLLGAVDFVLENDYPPRGTLDR
ncbi:redoxin domain-containing protein [Microbulbifer yueqingensis]|uniref:Peroxiredoxin n=1 Tax=Microbulbifer yueqingensis TaxID=658219 RepID=A0A1G9CKT7_9GAMM|nr:redoxin domain-containing protein [Microbulbifer yueqingensis]SDK52209.1 Peroxiredoxin [Microbulbifer yueqingensis]